MTDQAALNSLSATADSSVHTTDAARGRLRKRYRSERIFKGLGFAAILVSVAFLVLLLSTVVFKGLPAFTYNFTSIPLDFSTADADPKRIDYDAVVRDSLRAQFPEVTERSERRILSSLISPGAPVILREQVLANPASTANPRAFSLPISDFADLYLKGQISGSLVEPGGAAASLAVADDQVTITMADGRFAPVLATITARLVAEAASTRNRLSGALSSKERTAAELGSLTARLAAGPADVDRGWIEAGIRRLTDALAALETQIAGFEKEADELDRRAASAVDGETLTRADPSLLIYAGGAAIKIAALTPTTATGSLIGGAAPPANLDDWTLRLIDIPEANRKFTDQEIVWTDELVAKGFVNAGFNWIFATRGASREPEMAGVLGALVGSVLTLIVTLGLSFPVGVAAAVYLEEFAPRNRWTTLIEVNINNLAAVPSIVFGLLGLAVFLNFFGLDRSAPYVGGMVLALMTLPIIIIASRAALRAVPPSIREAALGIGASKLQTVTHHVLPLAMPGIMTGTIIGMAHALGETAPLLMIGMVAFVVDIPQGFADPATLMPVQIFMWADFPEPAFEQRTSAAILVLLAFLVAMNALAVILRKRFERRW